MCMCIGLNREMVGNTPEIIDRSSSTDTFVLPLEVNDPSGVK